MQPTDPATSPFRQKIFSLMNQQHPSKIIKLSQKLHNKTINTSHSPFKEYSIETDLADSHKLSGLDSSSGVLHFKSLQEKLGLKNVSNEKSRGKHSSDKSRGKQLSNKSSDNKYKRGLGKGEKKEQFGEGSSSKFYFNQSKSESKKKNSLKKQLSKGSSSVNKYSHPMSPKLQVIQKKFSSKNLKKSKPTSNNKSTTNNKFFQSVTQQSKKPFQSTNQYLESSEKQTQKKNYLLQTLKKMQSVRKNLTRTFEQFDKEQNSRTERGQSKGQKGKSKSNLTVISDFVNEESESVGSYRVKNKGNERLNKSKSNKRLCSSNKKLRQGASSKKQTTQKSLDILHKKSPDIFHKKTPSKTRYLTQNQPLGQASNQSISHQPTLLPKSLLKQIILSCKHPQKWQTLLQNDLISILFRIVKRKLIEIEIHAQQAIQSLQIELQKGALVCQSLKEKYEGVRKKEIITLLCSVRGVEVGTEGQGVFELPKLMVKIQAMIEENSITFRKEVGLPYAWVMLVQRQRKQKPKLLSSNSKKDPNQSILNRVKTRTSLPHIPLLKGQKCPNLLQILSFCQTKLQKEKSPKRQKKTMNSSSHKLTSNSSINNNTPEQNRFLYAFEFEGQEFMLTVTTNTVQKNNRSKGVMGKSTYYDLELEGKGQALMGKLLLFLELLS